MTHELPTQSFGPTSGVVTGWIGVVVGIGAAGLLLVQDPGVFAVRVSALVLAAVVVVWAFMLRPRILIQRPTLVLRNAFVDWRLPLASVEEVLVRQTTIVVADDRRYVGIAVGRSLRKLMKGDGRKVADALSPVGEARVPDARFGTADIPDFMTEQILVQAGQARDLGESGTAERRLALPELIAIGVLLVVFLVLLPF